MTGSSVIGMIWWTWVGTRPARSRRSWAIFARTPNGTSVSSIILTSICAAWSAIMISRSAARRLTWGAAPPCWSQTTAPPSASRLHLLPFGRVALHLITVGGNSAHLASLWLTLLPGMINSPPQDSEPARQLSDPGCRIFDGLHSPVVRDLDGRDASGDLLVPLPQL